MQRLSASDKAFQAACFIYLFLAGIIVAYPLLYVIACSLSSPTAILQGKVIFFPVDFTFNAYESVLNYPLLVTGFFNSIFYVVGGTTAAVILLLLCAYPLSRKDMPDRKFLQIYFVVTMFFSGGIIPNYMLMRNLHLIGSRWALVLGFMFSCYNMIIVKSYFQTSLPAGLLDAARIDGCDDVYFFLVIALPLAAPVVAVMILFNAVGIWNSYFNGMMYLVKPDTFNFQMILRNILFVASMPPEILGDINPESSVALQDILQQLRYSVLVIGALPMMVLYPFIQKYFIRGMMIGSLKE
jgi:ABC-type glycerol-3-phosphate transport system permease component